MRLFLDYIATKKVVAVALTSFVGGAAKLSGGTRITDAMALLVERARASGDIRPHADANDLLRALVGFTFFNAGPDWRASALRLIDILMDGLRPPPAVR